MCARTRDLGRVCCYPAARRETKCRCVASCGLRIYQTHQIHPHSLFPSGWIQLQPCTILVLSFSQIWKRMPSEDGYFPLHPSNSFISTIHLRAATITLSFSASLIAHIPHLWPWLPWQLVLPICNLNSTAVERLISSLFPSLHQISSSMAAKGAH